MDDFTVSAGLVDESGFPVMPGPLTAGEFCVRPADPIGTLARVTERAGAGAIPGGRHRGHAAEFRFAGRTICVPADSWPEMRRAGRGAGLTCGPAGFRGGPRRLPLFH